MLLSKPNFQKTGLHKLKSSQRPDFLGKSSKKIATIYCLRKNFNLSIIEINL
jgi:hypothetical protein